MFGFLRTFISVLLVAGFAAPIFAWGPFVAVEAENRDAIKWAPRPILISISSSFDNAPNIKYGSNVERAIEQSIDSWRPYVDLQIVTQGTDLQNVSSRGKSGDGVNLITIAPTQQNTFFFARDSQTPAMTRLFYSNRTQITEADIVLNPAQQFSTDGTFGTFDLESVLRHEIGHLLGLTHSSVPGSIMYDRIARNGVARQASEITQIDVAAIRELYDLSVTDENCCGAIEGRIAAGKLAVEFEVWAVRSESGAVAGITSSTKNRTFKIGGLSDGSYKVFARTKNSVNSIAQQSLGEFAVKSDVATRVFTKFAARLFSPRITSIGINGVVSDQAIVLDQDSSTSILVAGDSVSRSKLRIEVDSSFIMIEEGSVTPIDYSDELDVLSMRIYVSPQTPAGNYSICVLDSNDARNCLIGGIRVPE